MNLVGRIGFPPSFRDDLSMTNQHIRMQFMFFRVDFLDVFLDGFGRNAFGFGGASGKGLAECGDVK